MICIISFTRSIKKGGKLNDNAALRPLTAPDSGKNFTFFLKKY